MLHHIDCLEFMRGMVERGERVDAIITDPPYLYLNHKLDRQFNDREFFELASKITNKILFFGRGDSFYKWNLLCAEFGFEFKEEIIWDKKQLSSPVLPLGRTHETISVRMKKGSKINKIRTEFLREVFNTGDFHKLINDLKHLISSIKNSDIIKNYLEKGEVLYKKRTHKHKITTKIDKEKNKGIKTIDKYTEGCLLSSIIRENREHYQMQHPTQKPVRLLRKLVLLVSDKGDTIFDPFMGSASTGLACLLENRKFIGCEIDKEYFAIAANRYNAMKNTLKQNLFYGAD